VKPFGIIPLIIASFFFSSFGDDTVAITDTIVNNDWRAVSLPPASSEISARIIKYRTKEVSIILKDSAGKPLKNGKNVTINMVRHAFLFGGGIFPWNGANRNSPFERKKRGYFAALFNYATLPIFWGLYEKERGKDLENTLRQFAGWCVINHIRPKGHPLGWHGDIPEWAKNLSQEDFEATVQKRVKKIVENFSGLIDTWDVFNESLAASKIIGNPISRWISRVGPTECVKQFLIWARSANPRALLIVNDFDNSIDYDNEISSLISQGHRPDAMGMQAHFDLGFPPDSLIWLYLERLKKLNIPLHITETSVTSRALMETRDKNNGPLLKNCFYDPAGERNQARQTLRFYRLLFSHPSVEAITWWDLHDPSYSELSGLLRSDLSPKPAYNTLMKLVHDEWSTHVTTRTDEKGKITFRGFFGHYELTVDGKKAEFDVKKEDKKTIGITL